MVVDQSSSLLDRLSSVRTDLARARAELRDAEDHQHLCQLHVEIATVNAAADPKSLGTNESDRKRTFAAVIAGDTDCQYALARLRAAQQAVESLQFTLETLNDERRLRDLANRERIVALVEAGGDLSLLATAL